MTMTIREGLTFDDVMLIPRYSDVSTRSDIDLSAGIGSYRYSHPIIPANMQTIVGPSLVAASRALNGLAIMHRFMSHEALRGELGDMIRTHGSQYVAASVGVQPIDRLHVQDFITAGAKIICVDVAHGDSKSCCDMVEWIHTHDPNVHIIAGNVATGEGARRLWARGATTVKVGIGAGSLCTTRIKTGNGVPMLTSLMAVAEVRSDLRIAQPNRTYSIIADGGMREGGDLVKALCFTDMVMLGSAFAGCEEAAGEKMIIDNVAYKEYVGSSTHNLKHVEGVTRIVPCKGSFRNILNEFLEGVRSGCSYQGAHDLDELKKDPEFIKISSAGLRESHPHNVKITSA